MNYAELGWKKGTKWSGKAPNQDWHKNGVLIHYGTIQIHVGNGDGDPKYNDSTMFACVNYFVHRGSMQGEMSQLTAQQAFDVAVAMGDGLIASGFNYRIAIDTKVASEKNDEG